MQKDIICIISFFHSLRIEILYNNKSYKINLENEVFISTPFSYRWDVMDIDESEKVGKKDKDDSTFVITNYIFDYKELIKFIINNIVTGGTKIRKNKYRESNHEEYIRNILIEGVNLDTFNSYKKLVKDGFDMNSLKFDLLQVAIALEPYSFVGRKILDFDTPLKLLKKLDSSKEKDKFRQFYVLYKIVNSLLKKTTIMKEVTTPDVLSYDAYSISPPESKEEKIIIEQKKIKVWIISFFYSNHTHKGFNVFYVSINDLKKKNKKLYSLLKTNIDEVKDVDDLDENLSNKRAQEIIEKIDISNLVKNNLNNYIIDNELMIEITY